MNIAEGSKQWPRLTVATLVSSYAVSSGGEAIGRDGDGQERFLVVEETIAGVALLNQPAGHVENGETLIEAAKRETLEETGWQVEPSHILGIYLYQTDSGVCYHRIGFIAEAQAQVSLRLDADIDRIHWLTAEQLQAQQSRHRSPLVWQSVVDYQRGQRFPLETIRPAQLVYR